MYYYSDCSIYPSFQWNPGFATYSQQLQKPPCAFTAHLSAAGHHATCFGIPKHHAFHPSDEAAFRQDATATVPNPSTPVTFGIKPRHLPYFSTIQRHQCVTAGTASSRPISTATQGLHDTVNSSNPCMCHPKPSFRRPSSRRLQQPRRLSLS